MATVVSAFATIHTPLITGSPGAAPDDLRSRVLAGFDEMRRRIADQRPDVIVAFSSEHVVNLTPHHASSFVVGIGARYPIRPEPFDLPAGSIPGAADVGVALAEHLVESEFDITHSVAPTIDHGTVLPLSFLVPDLDIPIILVLINSLFPPLPRPSRCYALGRAIHEFVEARDSDERFSLLATGGLSHSVGERRMGLVDTDFDRHFLERMKSRDDDALASLSQDDLDRAGNGTNEVRNWLALLGATPERVPEVLLDEPFIPGWATGGYQLAFS